MSDLSPHGFPEFARGWTRERKAQFLDYLSENGNVRAACKRVGLSREAAYRLRRRDGEFARGWAAALVLAHDAVVEVLADRAIDGIEVDVWHRGELVGTQRKYDTRLLLAHLARLDKLVEDKAAQRDAGRFDELLACIAGEHVPQNLSSEDEVLPLCREESAREAAAAAEAWLRDATLAETGEEPGEEACIAAFRGGRAAGQARWDVWYDNACGYVDWISGWEHGARVPPLRGDPQEDDDADESALADFDPGTVSDVSTGCDPAAYAAREADGESDPPSAPET